MEAGLHVYLAKPVAVDVPGCQSIQETGRQARRKGQVFLVDFQTRTNEFFIEALRRRADAAQEDPAARRAASGAAQSARTALVPSLVDGWFAATAVAGAGSGSASTASGARGGQSPGHAQPRVAPPSDGGDCPVCIAEPQ